MKNKKFYTLHLDNNFPNIENIYYIHSIGKGIDLEISHFQLTKTLKMNIRKHSTKKDRTNDSFNLYRTNAPDPFKSVTYERTKWVRCGHLNPPHSPVQA